LFDASNCFEMNPKMLDNVAWSTCNGRLSCEFTTVMPRNQKKQEKSVIGLTMAEALDLGFLRLHELVRGRADDLGDLRHENASVP
jgi:hypothetical protein